jgi:hypothetical protein
MQRKLRRLARNNSFWIALGMLTAFVALVVVLVIARTFPEGDMLEPGEIRPYLSAQDFLI